MEALKNIIKPLTQEEINEHKADESCPALYVGTYHKYNNGSLKGLWVDVSSFSDADEFFDFCARPEREQEVITEYLEEVDSTADFDDIIDKLVFEGSIDDFAYELADKQMSCINGNDWLKIYFDYAQFALDIALDYTVTSNYVFG